MSEYFPTSWDASWDGYMRPDLAFRDAEGYLHDLHECMACGALVRDPSLHASWHTDIK